MRALIVALALLVGFTSADAREADLVKLRDTAAKPAPKKSSTMRAKKKPQPVRRTIAKPKPKPKKKKAKEESEEVRLRPMP
jgi:hypothetical protein